MVTFEIKVYVKNSKQVLVLRYIGSEGNGLDENLKMDYSVIDKWCVFYESERNEISDYDCVASTPEMATILFLAHRIDNIPAYASRNFIMNQEDFTWQR